MAISSSSTGLRPGVCTSTTRPTTPYTGQIIYETDTGYLRVWDGAAWDYLSQKQDYTAGLTTGKLLQVVQAGYSTGVTNNTNVLADTGLSCSITPNSASNKVLVIVNQNGVSKEAGNAGSSVYLSLRRGTTEIHAFNSFLYTNASELITASWNLTQLDSPNTTSSVTYKTQFCNMVNAAGVNVQRSIGSGWQSSYMQLVEIAG